MKTEDHNLGLPDQRFNNPHIDELIQRARLAEAELFLQMFSELTIPPCQAYQRIQELKRRIREWVA